MTPKRRHLGGALLALALALTVPASARAAELLVLAGSSLTNALRDVGVEFEKAHPGQVVIFNFAASDVLLTQLDRGAPADVYASADEAAMDKAQAQDLVEPATRFDFASNRLVLVVPSGKPVPPTLGSLADASYKRIALGNPALVPVGRYAKEAVQNAGLWASVEPRLILTQNVRQSLDYVARGECDAGFVYATDAALLRDKVAVAFDVPTVTPVRYPVAIARRSAQRATAVAFTEFLKSPAARAIFDRYGFGAA